MCNPGKKGGKLKREKTKTQKGKGHTERESDGGKESEGRERL